MAELDWNNLAFEARKANVVVVSTYKDGKWSEPVTTNEFNLNLSVYAGVFHYANACFEGAKAFRGVDGKVRLFRIDENAKRMQTSGSFLDMAVPTERMFVDMCLTCVKANLDFLPPYGYNASMYLRPLLIGTNPQLSVKSSKEVMFIVMGSPVGTYSGEAGLTPTTAVIARNYDRAAPDGTGKYKIAANYATSLHPYNLAHRLGYGELLFLDPATKTRIDEFGSSNFFAIKGNSYITPFSNSILPSITNKSLRRVAMDFGMEIEGRPVMVEELSYFEEVNACGTAVVITPIHRIDDRPLLESDIVTKTYTFGEPDKCSPVSAKLYRRIRDIQDGKEEDIHNWCTIL